MSLNKISINDTTTVNTGVVYDISKAHNGATYTDLADALGTDGENVPLEVREGGMSVRFIRTSDNKYVQYRLMATSFSTSESDWQGVDEQPTAGSDNLVKSGGVFSAISAEIARLDETDNDLNEKLNNVLPKSNSILSHLIPKKYLDKTGKVFGYGNGYMTGNLIPYTSDMSLLYSGRYGSAAVGVVFYNSSKEVIGYQFESTTLLTVYNKEVIPVENTAFVASCSLSDTVFELKNINITDTAEEIKLDIEDNKLNIAKNADSIETLRSEIPKIDKSFQNTERGYPTATLIESNVFCTVFTGDNMPTISIKITHINYKASKAFENNKIIVLDILEGQQQAKISKIADIPNAIEGINSIDVDIELVNNQLLAILGNDIYHNIPSLIPYNSIKEAWSVGSSDALLSKQIGDIVSIDQKLTNVCKTIEIIGVEYSFISSETIDSITEEKVLEAIKDKSNNYLNRKILCITGDSEAAGHSVSMQNTYSGLISERNGMTVYNTAVNGRKLAYVEDSLRSGTPLVQAIDEIREDADYILCQIGYNDSFDESEADDSKDINKYQGAFNTVIEEWQSIRPNAKIGIILPYYFDNSSSRIKRAEWMKQRCEYYHIQYIDGTIKSGLRYQSTEQKELYFIDAVHLTALGHERISYLYEQFMRGL